MEGRGIVCVSGGFDPLHSGHINYINEAKKLGNMLVVILNNDVWLMNKKGYNFYPLYQRVEILNQLKSVDCVYVSNSTGEKDSSVSCDLRDIRPDIFAKGGDRSPLGDPIPEEEICAELGIKIVYGVGGFDKQFASSTLVEEAFTRYARKDVYKKEKR